MRLDGRLQRDAAIDLVVAGQHAGKRRLRFLGGDLGQEAEAAEIDAEDRRFALADQARDTEQRAVAAEHHDKVRERRKLLALDRLGADLGGDFGFGQRRQVTRAQPYRELMRDRDRPRTLAPHDHPDRLQRSLLFRAHALHGRARVGRGAALARRPPARGGALNSMTDLRGENEVTFNASNRRPLQPPAQIRDPKSVGPKISAGKLRLKVS